MRAWQIGWLILMVAWLTACQSAYYGAMEKVGYHKREIMVDRVEAAQEAQQDAQTQFQSALERFRAVVQFDGGDLEALYDELNAEFAASEEAAEAVSSRIDKVKSVADALFEEWEEELALYSNQRLRAQSARKLRDTQVRYAAMLRSMEQAERSMQPVLDAFRDQVLYLKHNLNARAVQALKGEFNAIKADINRLIRDMSLSIERSRQFVAQLQQ